MLLAAGASPPKEIKMTETQIKDRINTLVGWGCSTEQVVEALMSDLEVGREAAEDILQSLGWL